MSDRILRTIERRFHQCDATLQEYISILHRYAPHHPLAEFNSLTPEAQTLALGLYRLAERLMIVTTGACINVDELEMEGPPYISLEFDGHRKTTPSVKTGLLYEPTDHQLIITEQWNENNTVPKPNSFASRAKIIEDFFDIKATYPDYSTTFDLKYSDTTRAQSRIYTVAGISRVPERLIALANNQEIKRPLAERVRRFFKRAS